MPEKSSGTITPETMTIAQIEVSPLNIRKHRATIEAIAAMEASILAKGLIQPINVHPLRGGRKFGAFAGGRRTRAIRNLVERGDLPAEWPVRVEVYRDHSDVEIIELSLDENIQRAELQKYEICAAIRALSARGQQPEAIAGALGQPVTTVRKWHRVGQLADAIFDAFAQDRITEDQAKAFASTTDRVLQLSVFAEYQQWSEYQQTPDRIRAALKVGDRQAARMLRLVSAEAYRAAGGRFELDLFADAAEERGRVVDEGTLRALVDARLDAVRAETRAHVGRDIRFVPAPPANSHGGSDYTLQVAPKKGDADALVLPDGEIVAAIEIGDAGDPQVTYWWASRKAKFGAGPGSAAAQARDRGIDVKAADALRDPEHYAAPAKAAVREEHGVSADTLEVVRSIRRELLRALLIEDAEAGGEIGRDHAVWSQLRVLVGRDSPRVVGAGAPSRGENVTGISLPALEAARAQVEQQVAHHVWRDALRAIAAEEFMAEPDLVAAFAAYRRASEATKRLAGAVLAGLTLERGANAPGFTYPVHDALAAITGGTDTALRRLWSPTEDFLALLPKSQLLAIAEPLVGPETHARWGKAKAALLPGLLAEALAGDGNAVASRNRQAAAEWLHPLLAFEPADARQPSRPIEQAEATA